MKTEKKKISKQLTKEQDEKRNRKDEKRKAFWEDIKEVQIKHGMRIVALLDYSHLGVIPVLGDVENKKEEKSSQ